MHNLFLIHTKEIAYFCKKQYYFLIDIDVPCLRAEQRKRALWMVQMGATHSIIARTFGSSRVAVANLMQHYRQTGLTSD